MRATWRWGGAALCMLLSGWACGSSDESGLGAGGSGPGGSGGAAAAAGAGGTSGSAGSGGAHDASLGGASGSGGSGGSAGGAQAVRFVAIGDCGKGNEGQLQVAEAVRAKCADSGCDFVQMLGDNIYDSGANAVDDPQFWTKFEEPYANITVPFWIVLGNHDYGGAGTGFEGWKADVQVAYSQRSNKWRLPARYYGHQEPGVDFYGTDTNAAMFDAHAQQKQDLSSWIQGSTARWKIALGHHPYRSNGPHGNAGSYDNLPFVPIVNGEGVKDLIDSTICGKVDVYISAHDHSLQWMQESCQGTELLVSGGGATNTALPGKNPTHYQASKIGFLYVVITDESFTGEFYDATGQLEFARTIVKP